MNRSVSGTLTAAGVDRPLVGLTVVAARVQDGALEPLGAAITNALGAFRIGYPPEPRPVDLTVLVLDQTGGLLYREPVHRAISGAELRIRVEVPRTALGEVH